MLSHKGKGARAKVRRRVVAVGSLLALCVVGGATRAQDLDFTLDPDVVGVSTGDTALFLGLLDNTLGSTAEFTGLDISLPGFDPGDISILFGFDDLANGASRTESMFSVYASPSVATGSYFGTATLYYDCDGGAGSGTSVQNFRLDVTDLVPEPALIQLPFLLGLAGLGLWRRRQTRT